jgi:hypothetical protein
LGTPIRIRVGDVLLEGVLNDTETARSIAAALPFEGDLRAFGGQVYVETPVDVDLDENLTDEVELGDIAYWHAGMAVAFFLGPTPETPPGSERPVPAGEVTVVGRLVRTPDGPDPAADTIRVERL